MHTRLWRPQSTKACFNRRHQPTTTTSDVLAAKCLVNGNHNIDPVRVSIPNNHSFSLKRGVNIGTCQPVMKETRIEENFVKEKQEVSEDIHANFRKSWGHLPHKQFLKATDFLKNNSNRYFCKGENIAYIWEILIHLDNDLEECLSQRFEGKQWND